MNLYTDWTSAAFGNEQTSSPLFSLNSTAWSPNVEATVTAKRPRTGYWMVAGRAMPDYGLAAMGIPAHTTEGIYADNSSITSGEESNTDSQLQITKDRLSAYSERIETLREYGVEDGIAVNVSSEMDFWRFTISDPDLRIINLVLIDNGNLRAVWRHSDGTHLGLQFLGNGMVQYVIFKNRQRWHPIARVTGRDTFEGLTRLIDAFDLRPLITE